MGKRTVQPNAEIGRRLRLLRMLAGLESQELARALGLSKAAYSHWEAGRVELRISDVQRLAEALELPLSTVAYELGLTDADKPRSVYQILEARERANHPPAADESRQTPSQPYPQTLRRRRSQPARPPEPPPLLSGFVGAVRSALVLDAAPSYPSGV